MPKQKKPKTPALSTTDSAIYALRMTANLNDRDDGKFKPFNANLPNNRAWFKSTDGGATWTLNISDSDSGVPILKYNTKSPSTADKVQFEVYYIGATPQEQISGQIFVSFGAKRSSGDQRSTPFRHPGGNARAILGLDGVANAPLGNGFLIGPFPLELFRVEPLSQFFPREKYEFSLIARLTRNSGGTTEVAEFGYDPEMDIDIQTGP